MGGILQGKGKQITFGRQCEARGLGTAGQFRCAHRVGASGGQGQRRLGPGGGMAHPPPLPSRSRHQSDKGQQCPHLHAATTVSRILDHLAKAVASRV